MSGPRDERVFFLAILSAAVFFFQQQALKLQAGEYDRRLHDLNNSHARLDAAVANNVSAESMTLFLERYDRDRKDDVSRFEGIATFQNKLLGAFAIAAVGVPLITAIVVYLLTRHAIPSSK